jgi:hypothetical protein
MMIRKICLTLLLGTAMSLNAQWGGWGEDEATAKGKGKGKRPTSGKKGHNDTQVSRRWAQLARRLATLFTALDSRFAAVTHRTHISRRWA